MKVVFASLFQSGMGGGAGRVAHELAGAFAREHQVVMVCPQARTGLVEGDRGYQIFGVKSAGDDEFHMPQLSGKAVRAIFDFLNEYRPDVIHAHDPALIGLICQVWAGMNQVPFVHTAHVLPSKALDFGTSDALNIKLLKSNFSESITQRVLEDFYSNCDAIIALNQSALESIRDFGYQGRLYVIPNGRDLSKYNTCGFPSLEDEQKVITFVGYITNRKNQFYLLRVLRHLPDQIKLRLIGKSLDEEYMHKLDEYQAEHDLQGVEFLGQVPHQDIPAHLAESHLFPSASIMEVQSLVVLEALASGTPVVGLSNETIDELVDDQVGKRLPADADPEAFAREIERLLSLEDAAYQDMCQRARERVSHLDWSNVVQKSARAYRELLDIETELSREGSDALAGLVSFFTTGEVEKFLLDRLSAYRRRWSRGGKVIDKLSLPERLWSWVRVPSSTWLISGFTILVSVFGYLFMKRKRKETAPDVRPN